MKHRIIYSFLLLFSCFTLITYAQEKQTKNYNLSLGADLASKYLWRGIALGSGPAIQPWGEFSYKGLTLGTWGNYEFAGAFKEVDIYGKYTLSNFSLLFVDLFFPGYEGLNQNYFDLNNHTTGHCSELGLSFNGSEKIPFSVYGGMILYGSSIDSDPDNSASLNHSLYFEVKYLGTINDYSYNIFAGFTPMNSVLYQTNGFSVFNIGLAAQKTVKVTDSFSMPMKLTLATNPVLEKIYLTFIISL